ncbi:hypothetical protein M3J09_003271 [Ascochyta lentis]
MSHSVFTQAQRDSISVSSVIKHHNRRSSSVRLKDDVDDKNYNAGRFKSRHHQRITRG